MVAVVVPIMMGTDPTAGPLFLDTPYSWVLLCSEIAVLSGVKASSQGVYSELICLRHALPGV